MTARLILVTGTGTGIGKTHLAQALLLALRAHHSLVIGLKPIETGLAEALVSDAERLERASTFHVQQRGYWFAEPLSPHLVAREAGQPISRADVIAWVTSVRDQADVVVVELPGGLFTPLSDVETNAHLASALAPDTTVLVGPDRLGVLHEVISTVRAAATMPLSIDSVALVCPAHTDPSTGRNAAEITRLLAHIPLVADLPRAAPEDLAGHPFVQALASAAPPGAPPNQPPLQDPADA